MATLNDVLNSSPNANQAYDTWSRYIRDPLDPNFISPTASVSMSDASKITSHFAKKSGGGLSGGVGGSSGGIMGSLQSAVDGTLTDKNLKSSYSGEVTKISDLSNGLFSAIKNFRSIKDSVGEMITALAKKSIDELSTVFEQEKDLQEILNTKVALSGKLSSEFNKNIMYSLPYAMRLGLTFKDIADMTSDMVAQSGRFKLISTETIEQMSLMSRVAFNNVQEAAAAVEPFQKVSRGASDAMKVVEKASMSSLQLGLNAKETTKKLVENVDKLNSYGFKNGVEGLTKMVQKAQGLRMELQTTFNLAEKVMDPTKALELSANLQAIGGAVGAFNDPIRMMWMATNNVEGLQDALAQSAENLTTFNKASGTFEVTGANLRRARDMATDLGMEFKDLTNLGVQAAQRTAAAADLMGKGLIFKDEGDKEFLTNLAQMKNGKMTIELPDNLKEQFGATSVALDSLDQGQTDMILKFREEFKEMSAKDVATQQLSAMRNIERNVNFVTATLRIEALKRGNDVAKIIGYDPLKAYAETEEYANALANKIVDVSSTAGKMMESFALKHAESQKKAGTYKEPVVKTESTMNHNVNITAQAGTSQIQRLWRDDPTLGQKMDGFFTNSHPVNYNDEYAYGGR